MVRDRKETSFVYHILLNGTQALFLLFILSHKMYQERKKKKALKKTSGLIT